MNSINLIPTVRDILGGGNSDDSGEINDICYLEKFIEHYNSNTAIFYYTPGIVRCGYDRQTYLKEKMGIGKGSVDIPASGHRDPASGSSSGAASGSSRGPASGHRDSASGSSSGAASGSSRGPASGHRDPAKSSSRGPASDPAKSSSRGPAIGSAIGSASGSVIGSDSGPASGHNSDVILYTPSTKHIEKAQKKSRGIYNPSCLCYANALFQMLSYIPEWYTYLDSEQTTHLEALKPLYNIIKQKIEDPIRKTDINTDLILSSINEFYRGYSTQEDTSQFFDIITQLNPITFFETVEKSTRACLDDTNKIIKSEKQYRLMLEITNDNNSIFELIQNYCKEEINNDHKEYREGCGTDGKSVGPFKKKIDIYIPSYNKYLFIQLKRFKTTSDLDEHGNIIFEMVKGIKTAKNYKQIKIETAISNIDYKITIDNQEFILDGFIFHSGDIDRGGHYYYIKVHDNSYTIHNDTSVIGPLTGSYNTYENQKGAYCLLYKKVT